MRIPNRQEVRQAFGEVQQVLRPKYDSFRKQVTGFRNLSRQDVQLFFSTQFDHIRNRAADFHHQYLSGSIEGIRNRLNQYLSPKNQVIVSISCAALAITIFVCNNSGVDSAKCIQQNDTSDYLSEADIKSSPSHTMTEDEIIVHKEAENTDSVVEELVNIDKSNLERFSVVQDEMKLIKEESNLSEDGYEYDYDYDDYYDDYYDENLSPGINGFYTPSPRKVFSPQSAYAVMDAQEPSTPITSVRRRRTKSEGDEADIQKYATPISSSSPTPAKTNRSERTKGTSQSCTSQNHSFTISELGAMGVFVSKEDHPLNRKKRTGNRLALKELNNEVTHGESPRDDKEYRQLWRLFGVNIELLSSSPPAETMQKKVATPSRPGSPNEAQAEPGEWCNENLAPAGD